MKYLKAILCIVASLVVVLNIGVNLKKGGLDQTPPEIQVSGDVLEVSVHATEEAYLSGVTAWDNKDGDLTDSVIIEHLSKLTGEGTVKITYAVFDRAGNPATATRTLRFTDYTGPEFTLSQPLSYRLGATVTLLDRLKAVDLLDGEITNQIRITSQSISKDVEGVYYLGVQVTNSLGDTELLELPVIIQEEKENAPEILLSDYIVYLKAGEEFQPGQYVKTVEDPAGNGKTEKVEVTSGVDPETPGVYEVTYRYKGAEADTQVILTVVVRA